ncbi:MAG: sensor histidine kinase [Dehalococcoidia bacterium]|nr:sensor histidine kinase [Dehalococcoidia bacterium]
MTSISRGLSFQDAPFLPQIEGVAQYLQESLGPGAVRILFSDTRDALSCACSHQPLESLYASLALPPGVEISPVSSCPMLAQGLWRVLCQRGKAPQDHCDILCLATSGEGLGAVAIQVEVSHFARKDFRYRRFLSGSLLFGLLSVSSLLESRRLQAVVREREEQARNLISSHALAREVERERLSLELHDGIIQGLVSVCHMVEALREMTTQQPEQAALLQRSEEILRQSIQETRGIINALHSAIPGPGMRK